MSDEGSFFDASEETCLELYSSDLKLCTCSCFLDLAKSKRQDVKIRLKSGNNCMPIINGFAERFIHSDYKSKLLTTDNS